MGKNTMGALARAEHSAGPIRGSRMECRVHRGALVGALIPHPVHGMGDESAFYIRRKDSTTWRLW